MAKKHDRGPRQGIQITAFGFWAGEIKGICKDLARFPDCPRPQWSRFWDGMRYNCAGTGFVSADEGAFKGYP